MLAVMTVGGACHPSHFLLADRFVMPSAPQNAIRP